MAKEQLKKLVDDSKTAVTQEFDSSSTSIKDQVTRLKKSALEKT